MVIALFLFLLIIIFGIAAYGYLRREQDKVIPKHKEEIWDDSSIRRRQSKNTWDKTLVYAVSESILRLSLFACTFTTACLLSLILYSSTPGQNSNFQTLLAGVFFSLLFMPVFLPLFPMGLIKFINPAYSIISIEGKLLSIAWCLYFIFFILSLFVKNKPAFFLIYLVFIILLTINFMGVLRIDLHYDTYFNFPNL